MAIGIDIDKLIVELRDSARIIEHSLGVTECSTLEHSAAAALESLAAMLYAAEKQNTALRERLGHDPAHITQASYVTGWHDAMEYVAAAFAKGEN